MADDDTRDNEPRAVDVVMGRVSEEELDPDTIAQLMRWFGSPAPEAPPAPHPDDALPPDVRARREAAARAAEAVDPALVARLEAWSAVDDLTQLPPPMENVGPDTSIARFDLDEWGLRIVAPPRELERPGYVDDWLLERTPQALLRDLHRPVRSFGNIYMDMVELGLDIGGRHAKEAVREAITTPYTIHICDELEPHRWMDEDRKTIRALLDVPWGTLARREDPQPPMSREAIRRHLQLTMRH